MNLVKLFLRYKIIGIDCGRVKAIEAALCKFEDVGESFEMECQHLTLSSHSFADAVDMTSQEVYEWRTNLPEGHSIRYYVSIDDPAEVHEPQIRISHPANV